MVVDKMVSLQNDLAPGDPPRGPPFVFETEKDLKVLKSHLY